MEAKVRLAGTVDESWAKRDESVEIDLSLGNDDALGVWEGREESSDDFLVRREEGLVEDAGAGGERFDPCNGAGEEPISVEEEYCVVLPVEGGGLVG